MGVNKETQSIKTAKIVVHGTRTGKTMGKNGWKSIKMSEIWEKVENPMPFERNNMENYGDLQPIARRIKDETHSMGPK